MVETQSLLGRIAALRQRLEQGAAAKDTAAAAVALLNDPATTAGLEKRLRADSEHDLQLDSVVRPLLQPLAEELPRGPKQLTARSRRLLETGRNLLLKLRALADAFAPVADTSPEKPGDLLEHTAPLAVLYRETAAMADSALRMVVQFPDSATAQLQLCEGLDGILHAVAERLSVVGTGVERHRQEYDRVTALADLFTAGLAGDQHAPKIAVDLAEEVLTQAAEGTLLSFAPYDAAAPARFAAAHGLNTARVVARLLRHDSDSGRRALDAVLAALIHDAGMAGVPNVILLQAAPLADEQRRTIEAHCRAGARLAAALWPEANGLSAAVLGHHERLDGTGYPDGLRDTQIPPLARLLAVADVFTALCNGRPYRPARATRTALTDTLLLAEQNVLDRKVAELLLKLSFYPPGTAVEMADGALGVVVAAPSVWRDLNSPARPVVAVLIDADGQPLPAPRHLDLMQCDDQSIVNSLTAEERRERIAKRLPAWS